ncbi:MAG: hypothetical protein KDD15_12420 [Lewinella sp.]|nr:hypothetical protein [Lewinella sp.]
MKSHLIIFFSLISQLCLANMASPLREGTHAASAFSSRDIDILREIIQVSIDKDFSRASYRITYHIQTDSAGQQVPLLFLARDYLGDFQVWVDDKEVQLLAIPNEYLLTPDSLLQRFSNTFRPDGATRGEPAVVIQWQKNSGEYYHFYDLKYFEIDLDKGPHTIRVAYNASVWTDISDWVKQSSFRYALSPAKYWRSFGSLEIELDATAFDRPFSTNLGAPHSGSLQDKAVWQYDELPAEHFEIIFQPGINAFASLLIVIGPFGLTLLMGVFLVILHYWAIRSYRNRHPDRRHSWVVSLGSLVVPFLLLIFYMEAYELIDLAIGPAAGRYHGYTFLVIFYYPVLLLFYWLSMWRVDKYLKRRISKS